MNQKFVPEFNKDYYVWQYNHSQEKECLSVTNLDLCDNCRKPATVNSCWVVKGSHISKSVFKEADYFKETFGELTELGADSNGNCFCEKCYSDHAVLED